MKTHFLNPIFIFQENHVRHKLSHALAISLALALALALAPVLAVVLVLEEPYPLPAEIHFILDR